MRIFCILHILVFAFNGIVAHDGLGRVTEHLANLQVEGTNTVALFEAEVSIACGLTDNIQRSTLALGNLTYMVYVLFVDKQTHTLLALVGNDFLCRQGGVANGQLGHVNVAATFLNQLRQTVNVSGTSVVVDADNGVHLLFAQGTNQVVGTLLHLRVGTLNGIQLNAAAVTTCLNAGYRAAAQTDAVVITTYYNHLVTLLGSTLQAVALGAVTHTAGQHDNLVVGVFLVLLLMLEGQHRTTDQWLAELVTEVAGTIRSLDKNLLGCLVQPFANGQNLLPLTLLLSAGVAGHIDSCSCNRP